MPGSDAQYDLIRVKDQSSASKADTFFVAPKQVGRDGAGLERVTHEAVSEPPTPPSGVVYLFVDSADDTLKQKDATGTVTAFGGGAPSDASYVTLDDESGLSAETRHRNITGADLHSPDSHQSTHQDGGSDELQVDTLAGDNGTSGQVLETDGSALSFADVSGTDYSWTEDANSPLTVNSAKSGTITLNSSFDDYLLVFRNPPGPDFNDVVLQVDGDTGSNYNWRDLNDNVTTSDTSIQIGLDSMIQGKVVAINGTWESEVSLGSRPINRYRFQMVAGENNSVSSPLDSITLTAATNVNISAEMEVYGR